MLVPAWEGFSLSTKTVGLCLAGSTMTQNQARGQEEGFLMLTLKGLDQIGTSRTIRSFRSCWHITGLSLAIVDLGRIGFEQSKRRWREARRIWIKKQERKRRH